MEHWDEIVRVGDGLNSQRTRCHAEFGEAVRIAMKIELELDDAVLSLSPARKDQYRELARRIAISYISWHSGVAYATTAKQLKPDVGQFWYVAAAAILALWAKSSDYAPEESGPQTID